MKNTLNQENLINSAEQANTVIAHPQQADAGSVHPQQTDAGNVHPHVQGTGYPATRSGWILHGLRDGFPICLGYFAVSFALGIEAKRVGLTAFQSFLMSTGMVASAGEFAALLLIEAHSGVIEMVTTCIIVNLRYLLMSCSLSQKLSPSVPLPHRFGVAYCITDEIFGLSAAVPGYLEPFYTYAITVISVSGWSVGTVLGVLVGNILPVSAVNALSVCLYGMFLAIIIPPAKKEPFLGFLVAVSMAASWLIGMLPLMENISGFRVTILTILIAGIAAAVRPIEEDAEDNEDIKNDPGDH